MSLLAAPIFPNTDVTALVKMPESLVLFRSRKAWLNSDDDVPITNPALSNPRTQSPFGKSAPAEKFDPMYSNGAKP